MKETTYVEILDTVLAVDKKGRRAVLSALFADLRPDVRQRLSGELWSWSCDGPPAFDLALGDENDVIQAAVEFKAPRASVNYTSLRRARKLQPGSDALAQRIYREGIDLVDRRFDAPHPYDGGTCLDHAHTGGGAAGIHQGDLYRACLPGVTNLHCPGDLGEVRYIFVAPHAASDTAWREGLVSHEEWHTVHLPEVLPRWQAVADVHPHVAVLVEATRRFLPCDE